MQQELEARYAAACSARCAIFLGARHVPDALAKLGLVGPNDRLAVYADDFAQAFLERFPRESLFFVADPSPEAFAAATRPEPDGGASSAGRTFWFVNSIGGVGLRVPDLRALGAAARAAGALLLVDNTVPSHVGCAPLELGAHVAFEALDRVGAGCMAEKCVAVAVARSRGSRKRPADPLADEAYELLQGARSDLLGKSDLEALAAGLDSLPARMQAHMDHARALAEYLFCHPAVSHVAYPGLKNHPDHAVAANVLRHGCGPAVDFELPAPDTARAFLGRCSCAHRAAPAGGRATRMSALLGDDGRYVRLFAGVDDPLAIVDSLDQALRLFCNPPEP